MANRSCIAVHPRSLLVVNPRIVEHESHIATVLPRVGVLVMSQLVLDCCQVHWLLDHIEIILVKVR